MERTTGSEKFPLGSTLPEFVLPNVDGRQVSDQYLREGKMALVVFTCNHCPYVKGSESQLVEIASRYAADGLRVVTISSNDAVKYPEDSFEKMKEKAQALKLPYPYLYDESQEVARLFDAACTPECYLFDSSGVLVFHGAINDSPKNLAGVSRAYLAKAVEQLHQGKRPDPSEAHPLGCSIKWR
jgi:peroxiredoxin